VEQLHARVRHLVGFMLKLLDAARDLVDVGVVMRKFGQLRPGLHGDRRVAFEEIEKFGLSWEESR
jgi:hypothetical protein